jgi:hypothetical protein|tara:strand:- start:237 stop:992 length:756 start_codon:yes stop_codon:yes gene_type:complete
MNRLIPVIAALVLLSGALLVTLKTKMETIENVQQQYDLLQCEYDSIQDELDEIEHNEFDRVYKRFKLYNKNIDTLTVNHFIKVVKLYGLDTTNTIYDACISQICLESGAKQFYANGNVVVSSGNAIGISQIIPTTAHHYLKKVISSEDSLKIMELGATDFSFVQDKKSFTSKCRKKVIKWLERPENNIILWGYIMKHTLILRRYNITKTLVEYNIGGGGLNRYIAEGNMPSGHHYVIMVRGIIKRFSNKGV